MPTLLKVLSALPRSNFKASFFQRVQMFSVEGLCPPKKVRGMTVLQRELFRKKIIAPCLKIQSSKLETARSKLKPFLLKLPKFNPIRNETSFREINEGVEVEDKIVILNPMKVTSFKDLEVDDWDEKDFIQAEIALSYDNWNHNELLRAVIPEDIDSVTSYSLVGHILHLNLRPEVEPYKALIGQVLIDKVPNVKTVVSKENIIESTFRNFSMELIAGEKEYVTKVKENGCTFELDFSTVYWNPRLCTEHERVAGQIRRGEVLYDVFAGIGPFAIPVARKGATVLANDLNPESVKYLTRNVELNKVKDRVQVFNKDGAHFIREDLADHLKTWKGKAHITMNLPALAYEFLENFRGLLSSPPEIPPVVHLYCFIKDAQDSKVEARNLVEASLGPLDKIEVSFVRNVAPNKDMMRVTFELPQRILVSRKRPLEESTESLHRSENGEQAKQKREESLQSESGAEH